MLLHYTVEFMLGLGGVQSERASIPTPSLSTVHVCLLSVETRAAWNNVISVWKGWEDTFQQTSQLKYISPVLQLF